jgi:hypothetical protein
MNIIRILTNVSAAEAAQEANKLGCAVRTHYVPDSSSDGRTFVFAGYALVEKEGE